jgi:predicted transcriptional regulator
MSVNIGLILGGFEGGRTMLDDQTTYSIQELFDLLPITIAELARVSKINEVTLARIRDGKSTRRSTVNKLLITLSQVYERNLTIKNVTGIQAQVNRRLEKKAIQNQ